MSATVWKPWETGYVVKVSRGRELDTSQPLFTFEHPNRGSEMEPRAGMPMFNLHNNRYDVKTFEVQGEDAVMHGFVGYFHATVRRVIYNEDMFHLRIIHHLPPISPLPPFLQLYKDVCISIHPPTHSEGMFSWFPIFFPIRIPIHLPKQSKVDIHVWRLTDSTKVWYEWSVVPHLPPTGSGGGGSAVVGGASTIHNPNGRSQWIGLF